MQNKSSRTSRRARIAVTLKPSPAGFLTQKLRNPRGVSVAQVRQGLPIKALDELARTLNVDRADLAEVIGTSLRTLQRKSGGDRLGAAASDRLARVERILALAEHVLGTPTKAAQWLTTSSRVLDDVPYRMLDTDIGSQRVEKELRQIEFCMPV